MDVHTQYRWVSGWVKEHYFTSLAKKRLELTQQVCTKNILETIVVRTCADLPLLEHLVSGAVHHPIDGHPPVRTLVKVRRGFEAAYR